MTEAGGLLKTIMIVGAGKAQVPLIEAARKENYRTIVCDNDDKAPGVPLADEYFKVSTKDGAGLFEIAKSRHIDGIVANSEYAMCDVAFIADALGLTGNPVEAIAILSSKSRFRELQKRTGLFAPDYETDPDKIERLAFPVIMKPDQSSGSRGAAIISNSTSKKEIAQAIGNCRKISRNGRAIIEEFIPTTNRMTIEGEIFMHKGKILWDGLFSTVRSEHAPLVPMTYIYPIKENGKRIETARKALARALRSANVAHGEYNVEMVFSRHEEPFIIEINPRQGGMAIPRYVHEHCGVDYYKLLVTTSVGDDGYWDGLKEFRRWNRNIVHHLLFPRKSGRYRGMAIAGCLKNKVNNIQVDLKAGDEVRDTVDASSCIGCVDLEFDNPDEQLEAGLHLEDLIKVLVE